MGDQFNNSPPVLEWATVRSNLIKRKCSISLEMDLKHIFDMSLNPPQNIISIIQFNPSRGRIWIPWERRGGGGGGLNQPLLLKHHLNGQMAPMMSDFLSSEHLKRFLGIGFDYFLFASPQKWPTTAPGMNFVMTVSDK